MGGLGPGMVALLKSEVATRIATSLFCDWARGKAHMTAGTTACKSVIRQGAGLGHVSLDIRYQANPMQYLPDAAILCTG